MAGTRRAKIPIAERVRIALAVLSGELTAAEAARRHGVSPMSVPTCKQAFTAPSWPTRSLW